MFFGGKNPNTCTHTHWLCALHSSLTWLPAYTSFLGTLFVDATCWFWPRFYGHGLWCKVVWPMRGWNSSHSRRMLETCEQGGLRNIARGRILSDTYLTPVWQDLNLYSVTSWTNSAVEVEAFLSFSFCVTERWFMDNHVLTLTLQRFLTCDGHVLFWGLMVVLNYDQTCTMMLHIIPFLH